MPPAKSTGNSKKPAAKKTAAKPAAKSTTSAKSTKPAPKAKPATKSTVVKKSAPKTKPVAAKAKPAVTKASAAQKETPAKSALQLAQAANEAGKLRDAVRHYQAHLADHPKDIESHLVLAGIYQEQHDDTAALGIFETAYALAPHLELGYTLASAYQNIGHNSKALSLWTALLAKTDSPSQQQAILNNLVQAYLRNGQGETAMALLERESLHAPVLEGLACILTENWPRALYILGQALSESPEDMSLHLLAGLVYYSNGQAAEAIEHLALVCQSDKTSPMISVLLAHAYWMKGEQNEALEVYESLPVKDRDTQVYLNMGLIYFDQHQLEEAVRCFELARKTKAVAADAAYCLAQCALRQADWNTALKAYQATLKLLPDNPEWLYEAGLVAYHAGAYHQAIEYWVSALELAPQRGDIFAALGHACYWVEAYDRAVSAYQEAISRGVGDAGLYLALGHASLNRHEFQQAADAYQEAINRDADNSDLDDLLAQARQYAQSA